MSHSYSHSHSASSAPSDPSQETSKHSPLSAVLNRVLTHGPQGLSDADLLSMLFIDGSPGCDVQSAAQQLLRVQGSLRRVLSSNRATLASVEGLGDFAFVRLSVVAEVSRRSLLDDVLRGPLVTSSRSAKDFFRFTLRDQPFEAFWGAFLDSKHRVIAVKELCRGTVDSAQVPIREVVVQVLHLNAAALLVAHNHPSGDVLPSQADTLFTRRLQVGLELVGAQLLDHLIIGDTEPFSFVDQGLLTP